MGDEKPSIIVDEDWKSKVAREREEAETQKPASELGEEEAEALSLFDNLIASLASQTLMALGLVGAEDQTEVYVDLGMAKHLIDTLMVIREKTAGNLSDEETRNLAEAISELQRVFATRAQHASEARDMPGESETLKPEQP